MTGINNRLLSLVKLVLQGVFYADLRSLALLRVGVAIILIIDLLGRSAYLIQHYTDFGILPRQNIFAEEKWYVSLHYASGIWQVQAVFFIFAGILAILLLIGYKTKLSTIASWIMLISLHSRNPLILDSGDTLLRLILFWGIFLPWQARYSVDSYKNPVFSHLSNKALSFGIAGYFFQVTFLYFFSAVLKIGPEWRTDHTAVYYALSIDQYATPLAHFLLGFPQLLSFLTSAVFIFEMIVPFLFFSPIFTSHFRIIGIIGIIFMQTGFTTSLLIGLFSFTCMVSVLGFIPSLFWERLFKRLSRIKNTKITIFYDGKCGFCKGVTQTLKTFFLLPQSAICPAQERQEIWDEMNRENSWVVCDYTGRHFHMGDAFPVIAKASPFFFFLAWIFKIPGVLRFSNKLYEYLARHRQTYCPISPESHEHKRIWEFSLPANILAVFFIWYILLWNLGTIPNSKISLLPEYVPIGRVLHIDQEWNMFAPYPLKDDGWYIVPGTLSDGTNVDLFRDGKPVSWNKPAWIAIEYKNSRWIKYFFNLYQPGFVKYRRYYAEYLCRAWNTSHIDPKRKLINLQIIYMLEKTPLPGERTSIKKISLLKHFCKE